MGLFDSIVKAVNTAKSIKNTVDEFRDRIENLNPTGTQNKEENRDQVEELVILPGTHEVEDFYYGNQAEKKCYRASFMVNDSFKEANSHALEVTALCSYAPDSECGEEGIYPSLYIDAACDAVENYKQTGRVNGALEFTELKNKFYFRAKIKYYEEYLCYFYGFDREGGRKNYGLCVVYPRSFLGTENEIKLMKVLDDAAATYQEVLTEE